MDNDEKLHLATQLGTLTFLLETLYVLHFRSHRDPVRASQDFEQKIIESEPTEYAISPEATMLYTELLSQFAERVTARLLQYQEK